MNKIVFNTILISRHFDKIKSNEYKKILATSNLIRKQIGEKKLAKEITNGLCNFCYSKIEKSSNYIDLGPDKNKAKRELILLNTLLKTPLFLEELGETNPDMNKLETMETIILNKSYPNFDYIKFCFDILALKEVYIKDENLSILVTKIMEILTFERQSLIDKIENSKKRSTKTVLLDTYDDDENHDLIANTYYKKHK